MKKIRNICISVFAFLLLFPLNVFSATISEIEPNNSVATATPISFDDTMFGVTDKTYNYDYYSFYAEKNEVYRLYIDNYVSFASGTTILHIINPAGTENSIYNLTFDENTGEHYTDFTALYQGYYYLQFYNSQNVYYSFKLHHHNVVTDPAVTATCTSTGLTEGKHCSTCGFVIQQQQTVAAKGHTLVTDPAVAATYTSTGLTEGKHCSICGFVSKAQNIVPKKALKTPILRVKTTSKTYKNASLKKKSQTFSIGASVTGNGKLTYNVTSYSKNAKKYISINKSTGKITVKKKTPKGTYRIKVKINAAQRNNYKKISKTVTIKVTIK